MYDSGSLFYIQTQEAKVPNGVAMATFGGSKCTVIWLPIQRIEPVHCVAGLQASAHNMKRGSHGLVGVTDTGPAHVMRQ